MVRGDVFYTECLSYRISAVSVIKETFWQHIIKRVTPVPQ